MGLSWWLVLLVVSPSITCYTAVPSPWLHASQAYWPSPVPVGQQVARQTVRLVVSYWSPPPRSIAMDRVVQQSTVLQRQASGTGARAQLLPTGKGGRPAIDGALKPRFRGEWSCLVWIDAYNLWHETSLLILQVQIWGTLIKSKLRRSMMTGSITWWYATPNVKYLNHSMMMLLLEGFKPWRLKKRFYRGVISTLMVRFTLSNVNRFLQLHYELLILSFVVLQGLFLGATAVIWIFCILFVSTIVCWAISCHI